MIATVVGAPGRDETVPLVQLFRILDGTMPSSARNFPSARVD